MLVTKDALLADLARALKAKHAESADQMLQLLEPALAAGSPREKTKKKAGAPKKLSGAVSKYAGEAAAALIDAFPDRGAELAEQLRMQVALGRIDRWMQIHRADYYKELKEGASDKDIAALEKKTSLKLPVAMHAFFRWRNGEGGSGSFYSYNTLMDCDGAASSWQIMHDLIPQFEGDGLVNWWKDGWLSFLENGGGDSIVLDTEGTFTGKKNQIVEFWHDDGPRTVLFPDLMTWAETFADSLDAGHWEVDDDEFELKKEAAFKKLVKANAKGYPKEFDADDE